MKEIAEFIIAGHPDKICDRIAMDCQRDPLSLVGVEIALQSRNRLCNHLSNRN